MSPYTLAALAYRRLLSAVRPKAGLTVLAYNRLAKFVLKRAEPPFTATVNGKVRMEVDINDYHGRILWLFGSNDWKVSAAVNALLQEGDVFLDIGANHGSIGFAASDVVAPTGEVHFFDPQPAMVAKLRHGVGQCPGRTLVVHPVALFDRDGEITLVVPRNHSGMATIVDETRRRGDAITVPMVASGPYVENLVGARWTGVKIDVEGAEPEILSGLTAGTVNLKFIVFEGNKRDRLDALFATRGYVVFGLSRSPFFTRAELCESLRDWDRYHDFVAVPRRLLPQARTMAVPELGRRLRDGVRAASEARHA